MNGADIFELDIPDTPPNLNSFGMGSRGAHMKMHRLKKKWINDYFGIVFKEVQLPKGLLRVVATAVCRFPQKRKRDEGNFRWSLEKFLGDALQQHGHLDDDTADEYTFPKLTFDPTTGTKRTLITLEVWTP